MILKTFIMNNNYNFNNICPSFSQYKLYFEGRGSTEFNIAFEKHINDCVLCAEAIEGYKNADFVKIEQKLNIAQKEFNNKTNKHYSNQRLLAYAATILIIVGAFSIAIWSNKTVPNYDQAMLFDYSLLIQENNNSGQKTLSKKSTEQYLYINSCNTIAYNDQIINIHEINSIKSLSDANLIRVEVANGYGKCALDLIKNIKKSYNIPIITIKEQKHM